MSMNKRERQYIEYRPQLGLTANIQAVITSIREDGNPDYNIPQELLEALETSPCSVLGKAMTTLEGIDNLLDNIEENLRDTVADGLSFQDYIINREKDGDPHIVHQWEDYQSLNADGTLLGEVYPILLNVRGNLVDNINLLNDELLTGDIQYDNVEDICKQQAKELDNLIRTDATKRDDAVLEELKTKNELTDAIDGAIDGIQSFLEDVSALLDMTVNDYYKGDVETVVDQLAEVDKSQLNRLEALSHIGFNQYAEAGEDVKQRMDRVKDSNEILHEEVKAMRKLKLDTGKVLTWLGEIDTDGDSSPMTEIVENTLLSVTTVLEGYDDVLDDMHKSNEMQLMQFEDVVDTLYLKESHRVQQRIVKDMKKHFDHTDRDRKKQVKRFAENMGYRKGIRKKKTHKKRGLNRGAK